MKKAILGNRIYITVDAELTAKLKEALTYRIPAKSKFDYPVVIRNYKALRPGLASIPAGREDLIPDDYEIIDKRISVKVELPEFKFKLRESQQAILDEIDSGALINAKVSFGKTFTALAIAGKLKQKMLVVTHTTSLRNQWVQETEKVFGFTPGIIGSGKFDVSTPIVISNIQTLVKKLPQVAKLFGVVVVDEVHHAPSSTFTTVIDAMWCKYKIGLSGTMKRKDGKHVVFPDFFGASVFQPPAENFMPPKVKIVKSAVKLVDGIPWADRMTKLAGNVTYQTEIVTLAKLYAKQGHNVLLVSDRVFFLETCAEMIGSKAVCITGSIALEDRDSLMNKVATGTGNILCGTRGIFSEGISLDELSCLIIATPMNNEPLLEQLVGRIIRIKEGKLDPVVVDIALLGRTAKNQMNARLGFYMRQGWKVDYVN